MKRSTILVGAAALAAGIVYLIVAQPQSGPPPSSAARDPSQTGATLLQAQATEAADPRTRKWQREGWKTDFSRVEIDVGEILSGGPPRDGIPSIDDPAFNNVADETGIPDREPVLSLVVNGDARAYPLRIMMWHEIVNDVVGGVPVAVTYCPLCNAAIVFDATVNGTARDFGTTGK
ncbi:MAG: DUF3179 domain-containing (seleno)protein, partial [Alphaproteobacteria bacterium]